MRARNVLRWLLLGLAVAVAAGGLSLFMMLRDPHTTQALVPQPIHPFGPEQSTLGSGSGTFHLDIDADVTNGGPCQSVDLTADVSGTHQVAVCMESAPQHVGFFEFYLVYDDTLNQALEKDCPSGTCLDDNPDANAGGTTWDGDLGGGWDCSGGGVAEPRGDIDPTPSDGIGVAHLSCMATSGPYTSPIDYDHWPLAVITFNVVGTGSDTLTLRDVVIGDETGLEIGSCNPAPVFPISCYAAGNEKTFVTPTPTSTPTPTITPTPTSTPTITPTPTPTMTPEPCSGVCVAGFWDIEYTGSALGKCQQLLHQSGASTVWGEISCTHAALGSLTGDLSQGTLDSNFVIVFQQPPYTVAGSATYSSDGNSSTFTWWCTAGCSASGSANATRIDSQYAKWIDASQGGDLTTDLGDTLTVPGGALPGNETVTIDISTLPFAPPPGVKPLTRAYTFGPSPLAFVTPFTATVTFKYTQSDLAGGSIDPTTLRVWIYNSGTASWELVGGALDTGAMTITVELTGFSTYAIFGGPAPTPTATPTPRPPVGGIAEYPSLEARPVNQSRSSPSAVALAGAVAGGVIVLAAGGWYARRRWRA